MSEESLYNAMVRHQIYLEGFKSYQGSKFSDTAKALEAEYKRKISNLDYETLDELTKAQLKQFVNELKTVQRRLFDAYIVKLIADLEEFMSADFELTNGIVDDNIDPEEQDKPNPDEDEPDGLWASIVNDPIPGVGQLMVPFLVGVGLGAIVKFEKLLNQAWSNGWTKKELLEELVGLPVGKPPSPSGGVTEPATDPSTLPTGGTATVPVARPSATVGGLVNRTRQEQQSAINTVLQHVSQGIAEIVMRRRFNRYQWVSVLDSRTTSICRERDGNIYYFGAGPLPPAHINCRSHIVPVIEG